MDFTSLIEIQKVKEAEGASPAEAIPAMFADLIKHLDKLSKRRVELMRKDIIEEIEKYPGNVITED